MSVISPTASSPSPSTAASTKSTIGSGLNAACPPAHTTGRECALSAASSRIQGPPADCHVVPALHGPAQLAADVLDGLAHQRQQLFEPGVDGLHAAHRAASLRSPARRGTSTPSQPTTGLGRSAKPRGPDLSL